MVVIALAFLSIGCTDTSDEFQDTEIEQIKTNDFEDQFALYLIYENSEWADVDVFYQPATTTLFYQRDGGYDGGMTKVYIPDLSIEQRNYVNDRFNLNLPDKYLIEETTEGLNE